MAAANEQPRRDERMFRKLLERPKPAFPEIAPKLERMLGFMANVLVVEVFAEGTFDWGVEHE